MFRLSNKLSSFRVEAAAKGVADIDDSDAMGVSNTCASSAFAVRADGKVRHVSVTLRGCQSSRVSELGISGEMFGSSSFCSRWSFHAGVVGILVVGKANV